MKILKKLFIIPFLFTATQVDAKSKPAKRVPAQTWARGTPTGALNLVVKIKQTPEVLAKLQMLKKVFASKFQPHIDAVFKDSKVVHFGRFLIVEDKYLMILTEFDGDERFYTEFFRVRLLDVFKSVFALAENPPTADQLEDADKFFDYVNPNNLKGIGSDGKVRSADSKEVDKGYFFNAYPGIGVKHIQDAFAQ